MQKTCIINNYPMSYVEQGNGPTLLLVHGSLADYRYWAPQVSDLSSHFRVIALSLRYYWPWQWTGEDENFTIEQHASDIAAFISSIVGEPIHLIGHSRGAEVALQVALRFPELLNSLVLADPFVEFVSSCPRAGEAVKTANIAPAASESRQIAMELIKAGKVEAGLELFINTVSGDGVWRRLNQRRRQMPLDNAYTLLGQLQNVSHPFRRDALAAIHVPILLVNGERSADIYRKTVDTLGRIWPDAARITVAAAAHAMNAENPRAFNAAVLDFISPDSIIQGGANRLNSDSA